MTGMVQPDVGPPANYKEDSIDDPVSFVSILRGNLSFSFRVPVCPIDFVRCFLLQYHPILLGHFSMCWAALYPVGLLSFSFFLFPSRANVWIFITTLHASSLDLPLFGQFGPCAG